jgi:hypothetical protein
MFSATNHNARTLWRNHHTMRRAKQTNNLFGNNPVSIAINTESVDELLKANEIQGSTFLTL